MATLDEGYTKPKQQQEDPWEAYRKWLEAGPQKVEQDPYKVTWEEPHLTYGNIPVPQVAKPPTPNIVSPFETAYTPLPRPATQAYTPAVPTSPYQPVFSQTPTGGFKFTPGNILQNFAIAKEQGLPTTPSQYFTAIKTAIGQDIGRGINRWYSSTSERVKKYKEEEGELPTWLDIPKAIIRDISGFVDIEGGSITFNPSYFREQQAKARAWKEKYGSTGQTISAPPSPARPAPQYPGPQKMGAGWAGFETEMEQIRAETEMARFENVQTTNVARAFSMGILPHFIPDYVLNYLNMDTPEWKAFLEANYVQGENGLVKLTEAKPTVSDGGGTKIEYKPIIGGYYPRTTGSRSYSGSQSGLVNWRI